jgi:hypothetical protein
VLAGAHTRQACFLVFAKLSVLLWAAHSASPASAQSPPAQLARPPAAAPSGLAYLPPPGYVQADPYSRPLSRRPHLGSHEHEGLFLRISAGAGAAGMTYKERFSGPRASSVKTTGIVGSFEVGLGARVAENFMVHGNVSVMGASTKREIDGVKDNSYDSLGTTFWLLGAGATYYVMPPNLYLTLVLGTGGMIEHRDYGVVGRANTQIETRPGFAGSLAVGKEWWVGGRGDWGIGACISGAVYAAHLGIDGVQSTAIGHGITLAFSATLN